MLRDRRRPSTYTTRRLDLRIHHVKTFSVPRTWTCHGDSAFLILKVLSVVGTNSSSRSANNPTQRKKRPCCSMDCFGWVLYIVALSVSVTTSLPTQCYQCSRLDIAKQEDHQLVGSGETSDHSTRKSPQKFGVSIVLILRQTVAELFDYLPTGPVCALLSSI